MLCEKECPVGAISQKNTAGFLYPAVEKDKCIGCKKCIHLCPILNANELKGQRKTREIVLASNKSREEKQRSTSGGVFIELAASIIHGGIVYGAEYKEDWKIGHARAADESSVRRF